jgi:cytochrome P450
MSTVAGVAFSQIIPTVLTPCRYLLLRYLKNPRGESMTGFAVRLLAEDQELQQHLRQNPEQVPAFVEETLRLESPFRYLMRSVPNDTSLGAVDIPAGATVLLLWGAANRDSAQFDRPDEVDLQRKVPRRHVAFGRGIHHGVGAPLARIGALNVLTVLLERTSNISLDPEHTPRWVNSLLVRRMELLPLQLSPR